MVVPAFVITGAPALIIIVALLALLALGLVSFIRMTARGAKRVVQHADRRDAADRRGAADGAGRGRRA